MSENFDDRLDDFKSKIDTFFDTDATRKLKVDIRDFTLVDIQNVVSDQFRQIEARLKTFTDIIRTISETSDNQKLILDMTRISAELNTVYAKITSQDNALQNIADLLKTIDSKEDGNNILKIMNELGNFYRGFDSITLLINKNFTEFLNEYRQTSAKEEFKKLSIDIEGINNNTNSIISALSIIDHKYQDLQNLIVKLSENELKISEAHDWLNRINQQIADCNTRISALPQNETTENLIKSLEDFASKMEVGFAAVANLDKATKDQLSMKFADILARLADIQGAVEHTHFDEKFAQLNNFIATSLSEFADLVIKKLDASTHFENIDNKINISFAEYTKQLEEKFQEFKKLDELKATVSSNLVELANYLSAKMDEVKKYNELEEKVTTEVRSAVDILSQKFDDIRKYEEIEGKVSNSFALLASAVESNISDIRKYDELEEKISSMFLTYAETVSTKISSVDKFDSFGEFVLRNLTTIKDEIISNVNDVSTLNELGGKISNLLNAISIDIIDKIDKIGSLDDVKAQILSLVSQFTKEMEEKIATIDQAETVKVQISSSLSSLEEQLADKLSKIDCAISNTTSVLASKMDENLENISLNIKTNTSKFLFALNLIKDQLTAYDEKSTLKADELAQNVENLSTVSNEIRSLIASISSSDIKTQIEDNYKNLSTSLAGLQNILSQTSNLENTLSSLLMDFSDKNQDVVQEIKAQVVDSISKIENQFTDFKNVSTSAIDSKLSDVKSEVTKILFELNENSKNIEQIMSDKLDELNSSVATSTDEKLTTLLNDIKNSNNPIYEEFSKVSDSVADKLNIFYNILSDFETKYAVKNAEITDGIKDLKECSIPYSEIQKINTNVSEVKSQAQEIKNFSYDLEEIKNQNTELRNFLNIISDNKNTAISENMATQINELLFNTKENFENIMKKSSENFESLSEKFDENYTMFAKKADENYSKLVGSSEQDVDLIFQRLDSLKQEILNSMNLKPEDNSLIVDTITPILEKNSEKFENKADNILNSINSTVDEIKTVINSNDDLKNTFVESNEKLEFVIENIQKSVKEIFEKNDDVDSKLYQFAILVEQLKADLNQTLKTVVQEEIKDEIVVSNSKILSEIKSISSTNSNLSEKIEDVYEHLAQLKSLLNGLGDSKQQAEIDMSGINSSFDKIAVDVQSTLYAIENIKNKNEEIVSKAKDSEEKIVEQIKDLEAKVSALDTLRSENSAIIEKTDSVENNISSKIDVLENKISTLVNVVKSTENLSEEDLKTFMQGIEFLQSNLLDEIKSEIKDSTASLGKTKTEILETLNPKIVKQLVAEIIEKKLAESKAQEKIPRYWFTNIEADFEKVKDMLESEHKGELPVRLEEIRNIGLENIKLNRKSDKQLASVNEWIDSVSQILQVISDKIDKAEKLNLQEIKTRMIQAESSVDNAEVMEAIDEFRSDLSKKQQIQEIKIENIDEKLANLVQKQAEPINFSSITKLIEANARQTNALISRIDGIENQILSMQNNIEKLINYIEE